MTDKNSRKNSSQNIFLWKINPPKLVSNNNKQDAFRSRTPVRKTKVTQIPDFDLLSTKTNLKRSRQFKISSSKTNSKRLSPRQQCKSTKIIQKNCSVKIIKSARVQFNKTTDLCKKQQGVGEQLQKSEYLLRRNNVFSARSAKRKKSWESLKLQCPLIDINLFIFKAQDNKFKEGHLSKEYQVYCKKDFRIKKAINVKVQQFQYQPIKHQNIVRVDGRININGSDYLVVDKCDMKPLSQLTQVYKPPFNQHFVKQKILQLINALIELHSRNIVHNRVNLESLLLNKYGTIFLDFLMLSDKPLKQSRKVKNFYYISPENLAYQQLSIKNDVWAIGCLTLFLSTGQLETSTLHPYNQEYSSRIQVQELKLMRQLRCKYGNVIKSINIQSNKQKEKKQKISEYTVNFINSCLKINAKNRPDLTSLKLDMPFLSMV